MTEFIGRTFVGEKIVLDGHKFSDCTFRDCMIHFGATAPTDVGTIHFEGNTILVFTRTAMETVKMLHQMYHFAQRQFVEELIAKIRAEPRGPVIRPLDEEE